MKLSNKTLRRCIPIYEWDEEGRREIVGYKRRSHKKPSELPEKEKHQNHRHEKNRR